MLIYANDAKHLQRDPAIDTYSLYFLLKSFLPVPVCSWNASLTGTELASIVGKSVSLLFVVTDLPLKR